MREKCASVVSDLFNLYSKEPSLLPKNWVDLATRTRRQVSPRFIGDYIAGMTDRYALNEHKRYFG